MTEHAEHLRVIVHTFDSVLTRGGRMTRVIPLGNDRSVIALVRRVAFDRWSTSPEDATRCAVLVNGDQADKLGRELVDGDVVVIGPPSPGDPATLILAAISIAASFATSLLAGKARIAASENPSDSKRFGFARSSHVATDGDPIQVPMGDLRHAGPKLIADVPVDGPDGDARRRLLYSFGRGPILSIGSIMANSDRVDGRTVTGIQFGDQPIANYPGVLVSVRLGGLTQRAIPGFDDTETARDVGGSSGFLLRNTSGADRAGSGASEEVVLYSGIDPVDAMRLLVRMPRGLYTISGSGQTGTRAVSLRYRSRTQAVGGGSAGAWSAWTVKRTERADQSAVVLSLRLDDLPGAGNPAARFDVQVERVTAEATTADTADEMRLEQVVEVQYATNRYPGLAMLALELTASEQLTSVPDVTADIKGLRGLRLWDGSSSPDAPAFTTGWSNNNADISLAIITDQVWGMGAQYGDDDVDFASLFEWRTQCDTPIAVPASLGGGTIPKHRYDKLVQDTQNGHDLLVEVCRAGRCTPIRVGNKWTFVQDRAQIAPVEQFDDGCTAVKDGLPAIAFKRTLTTGGVAVPNRVLVQFANNLREGRTDTVAWPAHGEWWLGGSSPEPVNEQTVKLEGVTHPVRALAEAKYRCKRLRYVSRSERRTVTQPWVTVRPGDRYDGASTFAGYGLASGRLMPGSTASSLVLDRTVTIESGKTYQVQVRHADGLIELRGIAAIPGRYDAGTSLALIAALSNSPVDYACTYALGETGKAVKPWVCQTVRTSVDQSGATSVEIEGAEYVAQVYDDAVDAIDLPEYSSLVNTRTPPGPVVDITSSERVVNGIRSVTLSWRQRPEDAVNTASFRVYRRDAGSSTVVLVPTPSAGRRAVVIELADLSRGYEFCAIAVSAQGAALSPYDPRVVYTGGVFGLSAPPPPPPVAIVWDNGGAGNRYDLRWTSPPNADALGITGYQVLVGGDPASSIAPNDGAEDCLVLARTPSTQTAMFNLALPTGRSFTAWVRSVNRDGRLSTTAIVATVSSPAAPLGQSVKATYVATLASDGTRTNCEWNIGLGILRITDATVSTGGVWTSGVIDTTTVTACNLVARLTTDNDAQDPLATASTLVIPSIEADQWGTDFDGAGGLQVGMLMPPFPDTSQIWVIEVRTSTDNVTYSDWSSLAMGTSVARTMRYYQVRVRFFRGVATSVYRPAMRGLAVVVTN